MVLPVHLRLSAVVAIVDCPDRSQFIGSRSLKQAAPQSIWLFQESLIDGQEIEACSAASGCSSPLEMALLTTPLHDHAIR
jgi:hypothetical protein